MSDDSNKKAIIFNYLATPDQVLALKKICHEWSKPPQEFWSFDNVIEALARPNVLLFFIAHDSNSKEWQAASLIAFGTYSAELLYIYVRSQYRRSNLGQILLKEIVLTVKSKETIEDLFLEVRSHNQPAIGLYEQNGFKKIGYRKKYYRNGDDAIVYRLKTLDKL